jgi:hypothetical protein
MKELLKTFQNHLTFRFDIAGIFLQDNYIKSAKLQENSFIIIWLLLLERKTTCPRECNPHHETAP